MLMLLVIMLMLLVIMLMLMLLVILLLVILLIVISYIVNSYIVNNNNNYQCNLIACRKHSITSMIINTAIVRPKNIWKPIINYN